MPLSGQVMVKRMAVGSKSERSAVILKTPAGKEYVLRRRDGNPFADPQLDKLVGHSIRGRGLVHGYSFILDDWQTIG